MTVGIEMGRTAGGAAAVLDLEELLATRLLVQGNSGSGKSHLLRRLLEPSAAWVQQAVIDPEGDFASLGERFGHLVIDAEGQSEDALFLAGERARVHRVSTVLNLEGLDAEGQLRRAASFLDGMFEVGREHWYPVLVVVDEAQLFAPAVAGEVSDEARRASLGAMTNLMCRGRKRGLAGVIAGYEAQPGRLKQSAETSSFDTWIEQYRPDEHSINTAMSYYTKGELLGLVFDLEIRTRTNGARSLDDVMRRLMENHGLPKPGFTDAQLKATFEEVAGTDLTDFWNRYVAGVEELDFNRYFEQVGLTLIKGWQVGTPYANSRTESPGTLGSRVRPAGPQSDRVVISNVIAGLPGFEGGLNSGDELVSIDGLRIDAGNAARRINELKAGQSVTIAVFRREVLRSFTLTAARRPFDRYQILEMKEAPAEAVARRRQWLAEVVTPR